MLTNFLEIKGNPFLRTNNRSHERPEKILPWVSLHEMIRYTQFARNTKCYFSERHSVKSEQHGPGAQLPDGRAWGRRVTVSDEWKNCMPLGCLSQMFYLATKLLLRIGLRTV